ncbi:uncharacterized protein LOC110230697 [Arabidopsis lyrata subsp. lyrata]|uniref:uncharacterized protein LOC110230697 n=1 Tax=Arabidopsis lyrata subsp. lyrata TaxID=81972 RepID=UPI000A29BE85|nr:uncharacterized protein LOC110230697 [Arabidopsis lyrata subsp. lyrata]|eukprot:XP_020889908.1 uncharacterized protein LOC110230697 [Arabidopsis lyrata subsp. lyrata]
MDWLQCPYHYNSSPLNPTNVSSKCFACYEKNHDNKSGYMCNLCSFYVHEECMNTTIPSRHKHPLKIARYIYDINPCYCSLCETGFTTKYNYQCSQCSFVICIPCARKPLIINEDKDHKHELQQIPIKLSFTCDACGLCSTDQYPCICQQCCFIVHRRCLHFPRVICINRHDHRISYVRSLGPGKWICGVCRKFVNGECGAYSCLICPNYVVHSKCATKRYSIWDGRDLEGYPEEDESKPFEVIDQNLIKHFSHEHNLEASISIVRLEEDAFPREEDKHCYACTMPLYSELSYKCTQCDFILHDACANLPRKKRHGVSADQLTLIAKVDHTGRYGSYFENYFWCAICLRYCTGFAYGNFLHRIDVRCASISNEFKHESHPHWLFVSPEEKKEDMRCKVCQYVVQYTLYLRCSDVRDCDGYILCFRCATLPTSVRHKYDDHPLYLHYGEKNVNSTCCGICEEEIYLKGWFYRCNDCVSTLHTECVFKNLLHSRPGYSLVKCMWGNKMTFDLIPNRLSRPICYLCKNRCADDLVLKKKADKNLFMCFSCGFN